MRASPVAVLRYAIILSVTGAVAWGVWRCQVPGMAYFTDNGPDFVYPPSYTYTYASKHGWPAAWLDRRVTRDTFGRTTNIAYTTLIRELGCNLVAWACGLACTAYTISRATRRSARFNLWAILSVHVAVAAMLFWWRFEYAATYVAYEPSLSEILRAAPTTPLLRLLKCSWWVSAPVLFGVFCALLQASLCLTWLCRLAGRLMTKSRVRFPR